MEAFLTLVLLQCPEANGCRGMGALPGHAECPPCSMPHPYFPSVSQGMVISALSIKLDNKPLSKIRIERKPLDSTHVCNICINQDERRAGLHLSLHYLHALEQRAVEVTAQLQQKLSRSWQEGRVTAQPLGTPSCSLDRTRLSAAPHVRARNARLGKSPTSRREGMGT